MEQTTQIELFPDRSWHVVLLRDVPESVYDGDWRAADSILLVNACKIPGPDTVMAAITRTLFAQQAGALVHPNPSRDLLTRLGGNRNWDALRELEAMPSRAHNVLVLGPAAAAADSSEIVGRLGGKASPLSELSDIVDAAAVKKLHALDSKTPQEQLDEQASSSIAAKGV